MVIVSQREVFCGRGLFSPVIWYAKGRYHYSTTRNVKYLMFFSLEICGKIASLLFFQKGARRLSGSKCKQKLKPLITGLGEWIHDAFRELIMQTLYQVTLTINDMDRPCDSELFTSSMWNWEEKTCFSHTRFVIVLSQRSVAFVLRT